MTDQELLKIMGYDEATRSAIIRLKLVMARAEEKAPEIQNVVSLYEDLERFGISTAPLHIGEYYTLTQKLEEAREKLKAGNRRKRRAEQNEKTFLKSKKRKR